uniref:Putative secreted protein n=1 Tax=Amblyomma cajennense TaxID=34607 RepID=A0A023FEB9_AMBCJ
MLLAALVVLFLGLSDVDGKIDPLKPQDNKTIYENTIKVLQKNTTIGLALISLEISGRTCDCLRSRFWKTIDGGAERSLHCYAKGSAAAGKVQGILNNNITVKVILEKDMKHPGLLVYNAQGALSHYWDNYYTVIFATPRCFVLRTGQSEYSGNSTCVAISEFRTPKKCAEYFGEHCQRGVVHARGHCALLDNARKNQKSKL